MGISLSDLINYHDNYNRLQFIRNNKEHIIPFVGAGISIECGLFSWRELLDEIALEFLTTEEIEFLHAGGDYFEYADRIVELTGNSHLIMKKIRDLFEKTPIKTAKSSHILISSFADLIVTTNYDTVLETIARQNVNTRPLKPLLPCLKGQIDEAIQINDRCLLKLHGSIEETSSFILTSKQYDEYYGERGSRENKPLPAYLEKLFTGKKLLFVGCSLEKDRTLDILYECVEKYERISHYAIVPWSENTLKRIERSRQLIRMGIEPIYYPEGDYDAVGKLLCYVAEKNDFLSIIREIITEKIVTNDVQNNICDSLYGIFKQSFFETAENNPELLDAAYTSTKIEIAEIMNSLSIYAEDTYHSVLLRLFDSYIDGGLFHNKNLIKSEFKKYFSDNLLKETSIMDLLKKRWSLHHIFSVSITSENKWISQLSVDELNQFAEGLLTKLQYKNGMSFAEIRPAYEMAKALEELVGARVEYRLRTRILNSIGGFSYYFKDGQNGEKYLGKAIKLVRENGIDDDTEMLYLAKCYYNLALTLARTGDTLGALKSIEEDLRLKKQYHEEPQLYARSCDLYATLIKELKPFEAGRIYLEAAQIKESYTKCEYEDAEQYRDMVASWATALFNIGLLARDVELYKIAYDYVLKANSIRFKIVDVCNKDYCSSLNVQAELELKLNKSETAEKIITIIDSKQNLPDGFTKIMGHTWYVCAYYYYLQGDYSSAFRYINKSLSALQEDNLQDIIQTLRSKMLLGSMLQKTKAEGRGLRYSTYEDVYSEVINNMIEIYGGHSFFLIEPYRYLMKNSLNHNLRKLYEEKHHILFNLFNEQRNSLREELLKYLNSIACSGQIPKCRGINNFSNIFE